MNDEFTDFWQRTRTVTLAQPTAATVTEEGSSGNYRVHGVRWTQTNDITVGGWLLTPTFNPPTCAVIVGHGYAGRSGPDRGALPPGAIGFFPCMPGFGRSAQPGIPDHADAHVVHGIRDPHTYVLRACVEAFWRSVEVLSARFPSLKIGLLGESFCGGVGALALPWEPRIRAGVLVVPTFGNHPLRLRTPCTGSGAAVRAYHAQDPEISAVLAFYDAETAARHITCPLLIAPADSDPVVPAGGQQSVAAAVPHALIHRLSAGHPTPAREALELVRAWRTFFTTHLVDQNQAIL